MNGKIRNILFIVIGILTISLAGPQELLARDITIIGEINDQNELVSSKDGYISSYATFIGGEKFEALKLYESILLKNINDSQTQNALPNGKKNDHIQWYL